jgi:TctA family transporter
MPYRFLFPTILVFCCIGAYTVDNSIEDVFIMVIFGVIGYVMRKLECEPTPMLLGFVLAPMLEENFRRSMMVSDGSAAIFFTRPISLGFLIISAGLLGTMAFSSVRAGRARAFKE